MAVHPVKLWTIGVIIVVIKYYDVAIKNSYDKMDLTVTNESTIRNFWHANVWKMCHEPENHFLSTSDLYSVRFRHFISPLDIEIRGQNPLVVRILNVFPKSLLQTIEQRYSKTSPEKAVVYVNGTSVYQSSRIANSIWLTNNDDITQKYRNRLSQFSAINFTDSETPLIISYDKGGHYAAHYDYLNEPDAWNKKHGDRVATALLVVKTAEKGGGTVFPLHETVIQPNPGDVILFFNLNSDREPEKNSLHGGCPIIIGHKLIVSMWIRNKHQDDLTSPLNAKSYTLENVFGW